MSPKDKSPFDSFQDSTKSESQVQEKEVPREDRPITIMTEGDAYISERMKSQPIALDETSVVTRDEKLGIHRLSLPDFFEPFSYDCTKGVSCSHHGWVKEKVTYGLDMEMDRWNQTKRGKYVFRWISKKKRALDESINVRGWYLVNRSFGDFNKAPRILFSANGGVENGDSILGFMSIQKALSMRQKPVQDSLDRVRSEEKKHEGHPNFYKAKLDSERVDGDDFAPSDALQEGRDFK